jgi:AcrR family transcriptional regulator
VPRPRSDIARRKVIAAVTDIMVERGAGGVTIDAVAARSGVAKTTIYRHWPDRAALVLDTARSHFADFDSPDTGSLRGDLRAYFGLVDDHTLSGEAGNVMPMVLEASNRDPEMAGILDAISTERARDLEAILDRARERGEFASELDSDQLLGVIVGPVVFHKLVRRRPLSPSYVEACIEIALAGIAALAPDSPA